MNVHKNARLTFVRRIEMVRRIVEDRLTPAEAAAEAGVSEPTARKWLGRYLAEGELGLKDRSSEPKRSPRKIEAAKALAIVELRRRRLTQARIAASLGVSKSTVGDVKGTTIARSIPVLTGVAGPAYRIRNVRESMFKMGNAPPTPGSQVLASAMVLRDPG